MKIFKTTQEQILSVLQAVVGIVERRHTLPILANVLLNKKHNTIELISSDLEMQIKTSAEFDGDEGDFATSINARKLLDILRTLPPSQQVNLTSLQERVILQSGKSKFSLQTLPSSDFPLVQQPESFKAVVKLPQKVLKHLLSRVSFAMAVNDIRYFLNGILLVVDTESLQVVATDTHRLAYNSTAVTNQLTKQEVILPRKTVLELQRLLKDDDTELEMHIADNQAKFIFSGIEFITKLVEGKFPEYKRAIPLTTAYKIVLARTELALALQRVELMTSDKFKGIQLGFESGLLRISAHNAEQEDAEEEMDIEYHGPEMKMGFNVSYLKDILANVDEEKVCLELIDANSSVLVTVPQEPEFRYVVMPMRI